MSIFNSSNGASSSSDEGGEVYSTEETRIGTWIDGKPLYRKCFQTTSPPIQDTTTILVPFPDIVPIHIYGNLIVSDIANSIMPLNFMEGSSAYIFTWYIYNAIQMKHAHPENVFSNKPVNIVCEYTKTTDTAST